MRSICLSRSYINITITILGSVHRLVFYLKHTRLMFVIHRKYIMYPLRPQQVVAIYRFVTINKQTPWPLVLERTIPIERPPFVDEI
jgi:hypothetical protein